MAVVLTIVQTSKQTFVVDDTNQVSKAIDTAQRYNEQIGFEPEVVTEVEYYENKDIQALSDPYLLHISEADLDDNEEE